MSVLPATAGNIKRKISQVVVAHTCNSSYSGGRDQEDHIFLKHPSQKGLVEWLRV
jgi:pSer/pThr/pTyr-binding forkhead associated (FHA) protein